MSNTLAPKTSVSRTARGLAGVLLCALLGGCIGSHSPAPSYYLLTAPAQTHNAAPVDYAIGVGPVRVAPFLARADITVHAGGPAMSFSERERWGEPLEQGVQRVLLQNLHVLTGAETRNFPWRQSGIPRFAVRIDVIDLDRLSDGSALLEVSWLLEDLQAAKVLDTRQQRLTGSVEGTGTAALTAAYSDLFAQLAQQIAAALPPQTP
jgi:uncharacterized lipoprotein YmbA